MESMIVWWKTACSLCRKFRSITLLVTKMILFSFSLIGFYFIFTWISDTEPTISYGQGYSTIKEVKPGGSMTFYQPLKKLRNCDGIVQRYITGECGKFVLWEGPSTLNKGFDGKIIYPIHIPEEALPGTCEFRIHSRYFCNPIDWFSTDQSFDSDPIDFKVLPE